MEKIEYSGMKIVVLYLEKIEKMNDRERNVILDAIEMINRPFFVTTALPNL